MRKTKIFAAFAIVSMLGSVSTFAQLQPSLIFNNGMVLQRQVEIPVWGTALAGSMVTVSLNGQSNSATAGADGKWKVMLPMMDAGGPFEMTIESGTTTKKYSDVYTGDVWLASGQSNMELTVSSADDAATETASANNQLIRQFKVPKSLSAQVSETLPAGSAWTPATASYVGNFSAVAYYFAKNLQADINVPIGIINTSYGGSRIEAWMSDEILGFDEEVVLSGGTYQERQPTLCFNKMLNPLTQYPIKGFLWYQGESNADAMEDALEYGSLFKKMITSWRTLWGMGNLPFIWVQLPGFGEVYSDPQAWDAWPQLRENQTRALALPNTGEVVTIDLGDVDIHPKNKKPVGARLSLAARKVAYNQNIVYSGPRYKSHNLPGDGKVSVHFDHIGSGLVAQNSDDNMVSGFAIAGSNGSFVWASAQISGDSVIIWNPSIKTPAMVRYAWEYNPATAGLYNAENLPAAPFKFNVLEPSFGIKTFSTTSTTIERGQFAVLNWEVDGATLVLFNGNEVDPIAGVRVVPETTTSYTLKAIGKNDSTVTTSKTITIEVVDPKPTIALSTDVGGVASPETEITITASCTPPKGGSIVKVEFFVDGQLIETLTSAPYEVKWTTPAQVGTYEITGTVTDNQGYAITATPVKVYVTKLKMLTYEAENATFTGTGSIKSSSRASGGKYVDLQSGWVLTFDNVEVDADGTYPLTIRFMLNYQSPKAQILLVNGENLGEVTFESGSTTAWSSYMIDVDLKKGANTIALDDSWGWMSFDYIAIAVEDTSTTPEEPSGKKELKKQSFNCYPNPSKSNFNINYLLHSQQKVMLEVFNHSGQKIKTIVDAEKTAGNYTVEFDSSKLEPGVYFVRLMMDSGTQMQKLMLIR